ncbi:MAG: zinc ribbon domain-containing protein [Eubacterium sp.]|jgi:hypothetical protein|nr:zinc ribbon domain-containing protein [Eubacterium sp.]
MKYCGHCGKSLDASYKYCPLCGTKNNNLTAADLYPSAQVSANAYSADNVISSPPPLHIMNKIRNSDSSRLYKIGFVIYIAVAFFQLLYVFLPNKAFETTLYEIIDRAYSEAPFNYSGGVNEYDFYSDFDEYDFYNDYGGTDDYGFYDDYGETGEFGYTSERDGISYFGNFDDYYGNDDDYIGSDFGGTNRDEFRETMGGAILRSRIFFGILSMIPVALIAIGWGLINKTCSDGIFPTRNTAGLSIIKGVFIYNMVAILFVMFLMLILFGVLMLSLSTMYATANSNLILFLFLLVIIAIITTFSMIYCFAIFKTIKNIKIIFSSEANNPPDVRFGMFIPVFMFVLAGFSAISGLTTLSADSIAGCIALLNGAFYIIMAIAYLKFKNEYKSHSIEARFLNRDVALPK